MYLCQYTTAKLPLPASVPFSAEYPGRSFPPKVPWGWYKHVLNPLENHTWKGHQQHTGHTDMSKQDTRPGTAAWAPDRRRVWATLFRANMTVLSSPAKTLLIEKGLDLSFPRSERSSWPDTTQAPSTITAGS